MESPVLTKLILFLSLLIAAGGAIAFLIFIVSFILGGAPFIPTPSRVVRKMIELAEIKPGEKVYDLGCGDGRLVIQANLKFKAQAVGIEISPLACLLARIRVMMSGAEVTLILGNCLNHDISDADVIFCYLLPGHMQKLQQKLGTLKKSCRIVSHQFEIPGVRACARAEVEGKSYVATVLKYSPFAAYDTVAEGLRLTAREPFVPSPCRTNRSLMRRCGLSSSVKEASR